MPPATSSTLGSSLPSAPPVVGVMRGLGPVITSADDAFLAIVGYTRHEFETGVMNWLEMTPPDQRHADEAGVRQASASGSGFTIPYRKEFIRKDGTRVPVLLCCAFIPETPGAWIGYVVDLSVAPPQHAVAEDLRTPLGAPLPHAFHARLVGELVRERTRMTAMLDNTDALLWSVDTQLRLQVANEAFQAVQRALTGSALGIGEAVMAHPDYPAALVADFRAGYARALAGERLEMTTTAPLGGAARTFATTLSPIVEGDERIVGVSVVAQDVTDRQRTEQALRASEAQLRAIATASPQGIFLTDGAGRVIYANPRLVSVVGIDEGVSFDSEAALARLRPEDRAALVAAGRVAFASGTPMAHDVRTAAPAGEERRLRVRLSPLFEEGTLTGFVGTVDDETERYAAAQRQRQRERMESLGTLAGGIAHDFNNMLGVVLGHTELALLEAATIPDAPPALREALDEVRTASFRARDLVKQILAFSRRDEQPRTVLDLRAVVVESLRLLRPMLPASVQLEPRLPDGEIPVLGDVSALQQVIVNLCANAEHAMRATDGGTLTVSLEPATIDDAPYAVLTVHDTGTGMPEEVRAHVFEPFFTTKPMGEGTGMGLAVVHGVVVSHAGRICVDSSPGAGTRFRIALPIAGGHVTPDVPEAVALPGRGRVLVVEDEPALRRVAVTALRRAGYEALGVADGVEALRALDRGTPAIDVIVSDVTMPRMGGEQLARTLRERPAAPALVLMTGYSQRVTADVAASLGAAALLPKPFTTADLVAAVRGAIAVRG